MVHRAMHRFAILGNVSLTNEFRARKARCDSQRKQDHIPSHLEEVINDKNLEVVDELFSEEWVIHPSLPGRTPGVENARRYFSNMHATFPDIQATIESMVAEGDWVAIRATMTGTHEASGKRVTWPVSVFSRFAGGKDAEDWVVVDTGQIEAQLNN